MAPGSAESIFYPEMAGTEWNMAFPARGADNGRGGAALSCYPGGDIVGPATNQYSGMSEADKAAFDSFYKSVQVVSTNLVSEGVSTPENLLCIIGKNATGSYPGGTVSPVSIPNATFFWFSGTGNSANPMPLGANYRLTIDYRVIPNDASLVNSIDLTLATSHYDGIDQNTGLGDGGYRAVGAPVYGAYSSDWNRVKIDFMVFDNNDPEYNELPVVMKMYFKDILDQSVILFRSFKLEQIDEIDMTNVPGNVNEVPDYVDQPDGGVSVEQLDIKDSGVIFVANGAINVIDANAPIEVYNIAGAKVATVAAPANVEAIELDVDGVYVVKVGDKVQKVIL